MPGPAIALAGASLASGAISANAAKKAAQGNQAAADAATQLQREQFNQTTANFKPFLGAGNDAMAAYLYEMGLGPRPTFGGTAPAIETFTETVPGSRITGTDTVSQMRRALNPATTTTKFRSGGQTFSTLAEAEAFASKNKTGGIEYGGYQQSPMARYLMEEGVDSIQGSAAAGGGLFSGATLEALEGNRRQVIGADTADYFSKLFGLSNMGMAAAGNQAGAGSQYANNAGNIQMQAAQNAGQARMQGAQAITGTMGDLAGIYGFMSNPMAAYAAPTMGFGGGR